MKPKSIALVLLSIIICFLLTVLSLKQTIFFHTFENDDTELENEACTKKFNHISSSSANRTDYTIVSLNRNNQRLRGKIIQEQGIRLAQFLSVPYAENHVLFRKATPPKPWTGVRDATFWPPLCLQNKVGQYEYLTSTLNSSLSEHCLYLNIWSPHSDLVRLANRTNRVQSADSLLPVIVFIPGGGFSYFGISYKAFYGGVVAALGKVVYVTVSYRLGIFGFLKLSPNLNDQSNLGIHDQIAALEWVSKNIHHFGGNAECITLQGQSAGAISIGLLMLSPVSTNLFHRAILQSASPLMPKQLFEAQHYDRLMNITNCSLIAADNELDLTESDSAEENSSELESNSTLISILEMQCLENLSTEALNDIQGILLKENAISFGPAIPSPLFPDFPLELLKEASKISKKSLLIGANDKEASLYLHQEFPDIYPLTPSLNLNVPKIVKTIRRLVGGKSNAEHQFTRILFDLFAQKNITTDEQITKEFLIFLSDFTFKGPVLKFAKLWSEFSSSNNVFFYLYNQSESHYPPWIGPGHWLEMDFVFGIPLQEPHRFSKKEQEFSTRLIQSWTHFARTGQMIPQLGLGWPKFTSTSQTHMVLQSSSSILGSNLDMQYFSLFDLLYDTS